MKYNFSPQPLETISVQVESSHVWEVILGIAGFTHAKLRHTFELDEKWSNEKETMPVSLVNNLKMIEKTNFWYGLIMLQNKLSSSSVQEFEKLLSVIPLESFYDTLLPYKNRNTEAMRKAASSEYHRHELFDNYAKHFEDHDFLSGYIRNLALYTHQELYDLFINTMNSWLNWISKQGEWEKWIQALGFEKKQSNLLDMTNPLEKIEFITDGIKYLPEPSVWTVKLIPHVSYRPWVLEARTPDTKLFFYPIKEEYLLEQGVPPNELIRIYKALGDELRLKLLYQLLKGPLSLQELSVQFNTSKTTLHHQLSILKAAKFIQVERGVYSANLAQINNFSGKLYQYLGIVK
ncbi:ArsR family transcriptional regulator [Mesobacillus jeotgali]|uniref:ArsR family transcriptional regulator n=1 Tax=Mesobacillus jeotgali TaxID=129985 RepID=A0ABY9VGU3_9BACI|nr:ArsR family transcriptional regulator [Mesobacillus jeotgali]WNF23157.1 ArsR family transcriptional regulator [Mesobacillus jeotgali]